MTNSYINSRDSFATSNVEERKTINGREWGLLRAGDEGPCLVLLPGTLGRGDIFWNQIEALKTSVKILALSYPDSGSIELWAQDICLLMDEEGFDSATILGSSLGGYIAQFFAATYPERTSNLVAANTLSSTNILSDIPPYNLDLDNIPGSDLQQGFVDTLSKNKENSQGKDYLIEFLLAEVGTRISQEELRMRIKALKVAPPIPQQTLAHYNIFTIESADDPLIPSPVRDAVRSSLKPARTFRFLNGNHFPYVILPELYTSILEEVLGLKNMDLPCPQEVLSGNRSTLMYTL